MRCDELGSGAPRKEQSSTRQAEAHPPHRTQAPCLTPQVSAWFLSCATLLFLVRSAHTDGWGGYNDLAKQGYSHQRTVLPSSHDPAHVSMPGAHRVASLFKRWIQGTHQGSLAAAHLQSYLEQFTFRFNRRTSSSRGLAFRRLLEQTVATGPVTEADVTDGYDWRHHKI